MIGFSGDVDEGFWCCKNYSRQSVAVGFFFCVSVFLFWRGYLQNHEFRGRDGPIISFEVWLLSDQHGPDSAQQSSGDAGDGFLPFHTGTELAVCLVQSRILPDGLPGGLNHSGPELVMPSPGKPLLPMGVPALMAIGTKPHEAVEVIEAGKSSGITDLQQDEHGGQRADAGNRSQQICVFEVVV